MEWFIIYIVIVKYSKVHTSVTAWGLQFVSCVLCEYINVIYTSCVANMGV